MCNKVVLPALSRPRKRSLACLFRSPREASTSQTVQVGASCQQMCFCNEGAIDIGYDRGSWALTPVDHPHVCDSLVVV